MNTYEKYRIHPLLIRNNPFTSECHKCFKTSQALCLVTPSKHSYETPFLKGTPGISETELSPQCLYGKRKEKFHLPEMEFNSYPTFLGGGEDFDPETMATPPSSFQPPIVKI
ncbi:hypothetical protein CDAR_491601 [Caerostris darwini]|uniref:Uncharacterized protein n=1 Tax=Caerostris darwini TaxID=1538125 RepID=A0AAV4X7T9_9ARAC|nr:hypothetical protein CDAR_491601 [Caerostris darwini]